MGGKKITANEFLIFRTLFCIPLKVTIHVKHRYTVVFFLYYPHSTEDYSYFLGITHSAT